MKLIQLPHLAVGSPTQIAGPGLPQIGVCDSREAASRVEASRKLVGDRLVVDKAVGTRGRDGALVEVHGIERPSFDTGNLSADQRSTVLEVLRAVRRPALKLSLVTLKRLPVLVVRIGTEG